VFASKIPITMFIVTLVYRIATFGQIECNVTVFFTVFDIELS